MLDILKQRLKGKVVILGVGNPLRGDDGAGSYLAGQLRGRVRAVVINCCESPENFTGRVRELRPDMILIIDAVDMGGHPGESYLLQPDALGTTGLDTHRLPLGALAAYLESQTAAQVLVLGIQPKSARFGEPISDEVRASLTGLERTLVAILGAA